MKKASLFRKIQALVLTAAILISSTSSVFAEDTSRAAKIADLAGTVSVLKSGGEKSFTAFKGMSLSQGDSISTGKDSWVELEIDDDKLVKIAENTQLGVSELEGSITAGDDQTGLKLWFGKVWTNIKNKLNVRAKYEIRTPKTVMGVRGTQFFVGTEGGKTVVAVYHGRVYTVAYTSMQQPDGTVMEQALEAYLEQNQQAVIEENTQQAGEISIQPADLRSLPSSILEEIKKSPEGIDADLLQSIDSIIEEKKAEEQNQRQLEQQNEGNQAPPQIISTPGTTSDAPASSGGGGNSSGNTTVAVTKVTLISAVTLDVGESIDLDATIEPENATNQNISWSSDKTNIAAVDSATGHVTAVGQGTAIITVTAEDGNHHATCTVTVTNYSSPLGLLSSIPDNDDIGFILNNSMHFSFNKQIYPSEGFHSILLENTSNHSIINISCSTDGDAAIINLDNAILDRDTVYKLFIPFNAFEDSSSNCLPADISISFRTADMFIERASVTSDSVEADNYSAKPSISADGRYVAFISSAENLTNSNEQIPQVILRDRESGVTNLLPTLDGEGVSNPSISGNGRFVASISSPGSKLQIYDSQTGTTVAASVYSEANLSIRPSISYDGRYVAWNDAENNVLLYDRDTDENEIFDEAEPGSTSCLTIAAESSSDPVISADGKYVAFCSSAPDLGVSDSIPNIFVYNVINDEIQKISVSSSGDFANAPSYYPSISGDGRFVAFQSEAQNLVENADPFINIYLRDRDPDEDEDFDEDSGSGVPVTTLVTKAFTGFNSLNGDSSYPVISQDGSCIVFNSSASNLNAAGNGQSGYNVFMYRRNTGKVVKINLSFSGGMAYGGNADYYYPAVSSDGSYIAYSSDASDSLPPNEDNNNCTDVYVVKPDVELPYWSEESLTAVPQLGGGIKLKWSKALDNNGIAGYIIYCDGSLAGTISAYEYSGTYQLSVADQEAAHEISVISYDYAGNVPQVSLDVSYDPQTAPLAVIDTSPESGFNSGVMNTGSEIKLRFSKPIAEGVDFDSIKLFRGSFDNTVEVSVERSISADTHDTLILTVTDDFGNGYMGDCFVTLPREALKDSEGNPLPEDFSYYFSYNGY